MADINLSQRCEESPRPRGSREQRRKEQGQISQLEFSFVFTSKNFSALFGAAQTCSPLPHVPHMCLTLVSHTCTSSTLSAVWGFGVCAYPRWSVLYPSTSHFLLVDDVHQLHGVVALHVNHRPLQRILCNLVELRRGEREIHQTQ